MRRVPMDMSNPRLNAELWASVGEYKARIGSAPCLVCADFNFDLGSRSLYPVTLLQEVMAGALVDLDDMRARLEGRDPLCAYQAGGGRLTRIDGVLADP